MKRTIINISKNTLKLFKTANKVTLNGTEHKFTRAEKIVYLGYLAKVCKFDAEDLGWTTVVSNSTMSKLCGLDTSTVINCKRSLSTIGLINVEEIGNGKHRVKIIEYEQLHLTKEEGGTGYVKIGFNMFQKLCELNTNELRVALDILLSLDNMKNNIYNKSQFIVKYYSKARKYLPSYVNCKKKVAAIFEKLDKLLFDINLKEDHCTCKEILAYNVENYVAKVAKGNRKGIQRLAKANGIEYNSKDLTDLVQMSLEYGYTAISNALMYIMINAITNIDNLGALVRTLIKGSFKIELY